MPAVGATTVRSLTPRRAEFAHERHRVPGRDRAAQADGRTVLDRGDRIRHLGDERTALGARDLKRSGDGLISAGPGLRCHCRYPPDD